VAATPVEGSAFVQAVRAVAGLYRVDPLAAFASAVDLGIDGVMGYSGTTYGPWELSSRWPPILKLTGGRPYVLDANDWAWSDAGISYAVIEMAKTGARGLTGHAAVTHIVTYFEKPADLANEIATRLATYDDLVNRGSSVWAWLAQQAGGPSTYHVPPPPQVALDSANAHPYANAGWHDLLYCFSRTMPSTASQIDAAGRRLPKAVK
jgi:hypothetical protein